MSFLENELQNEYTLITIPSLIDAKDNENCKMVIPRKKNNDVLLIKKTWNNELLQKITI